MAVFRVERNTGYTVMSNHHLRNKELSLKAKGLLSQMLSLPEDWDYTLAGLSHINREKIDAIREAVKELEKAGYIVRSRERDEKGRLRGADYVIYEQPQRDNPLKHVEDTIEQNDNNFDGLINNTPQTPTVADFEQRAKAGEAISVTDLAKAVKAEKREQPQKKPSILKKLDEYKKQAAQQPKDKQKEHKKDLEV